MKTKLLIFELNITNSLNRYHIYMYTPQTCLIVRVPVEVVKQRAQAYKNTSSLQALHYTIKKEVGVAMEAW